MAHNLLRAARVKERLQGFLGCLLAVEAGLGEEALLRRLIGDLCLAKGVPGTVAHRLELAGRVDEHIYPDAWLERFVETAASVEESLLRVDDEDQIEIALAADVAASEGSEENRAPDVEGVGLRGREVPAANPSGALPTVQAVHLAVATAQGAGLAVPEFGYYDRERVRGSRFPMVRYYDVESHWRGIG